MFFLQQKHFTLKYRNALLLQGIIGMALLFWPFCPLSLLLIFPEGMRHTCEVDPAELQALLGYPQGLQNKNPSLRVQWSLAAITPGLYKLNSL